MKRLDEKEWKKFSVFDKDKILEIHATNSSIDGIRLIDGEDEIVPYITRTDNCNGIAHFVDINNYKYGCDDSGTITVGLDTQTAFYQPYKFITGQNIQIISRQNMSENLAHFFVSVLREQMRAKFNWGGNGATLGRMKKLDIILPINSDGNPDYKYMEAYTSNIRNELIERYKKYAEEQIKKLEYKDIPSLDEKKWKEFLLGDFGEIRSGRDIYAQERVEGDVPYITAGATNNGIGYFVSNQNETIDKGYVAFNRNGAVGKAFYHTYKSLLGNDCRKIHLKDANNNLYIGQFFAMCISKQSICFSYSRKLGTARARKMKIMLPIDKKGNPDFEYMEQYTKNLMLKKYKQYMSFEKSRKA